MNNSKQTTDDLVIVMFSGGVDSAYALWHYLTKTSAKVHVHHIDIKHTKSNEWRAEKQAVKALLPLFRRYRQFGYSSSGIEINSLSWDKPTDYVLFIAFEVAKKLLHSVSGRISLGLGWTKAEDASQYPSETPVEVYTPLHRVWNGYVSTVSEEYQARFGKCLVQPFYHLSKDELYHALPVEIRQHVWSCKKPIKAGGQYKKCDKCLKCLDFKERVNAD